MIRIRLRHPRFLLLAAILLAGVAGQGPAAGQVVTVSISPNLGKVASASSGTTVFRFSASSGVVSKPYGGAATLFAPATLTRAGISIQCNVSWCGNNDADIEIGPSGALSGRAGTLTNFTVTMNTAVLTSPVSGSNVITFSIAPIGKGDTKTFYLGADFPLDGDETNKPTGNATSGFYIKVSNARKPTNYSTGSGVASAQVVRAIAVNQTTPLAFGRIVRPVSGSGSVLMPATTGPGGTRTVSGGAVGLGTVIPTIGTFLATGEAGQTFNVSVSPSITLQNASGGTIEVTTSNTAQGTQLFGGAPGTQSSFTFYVGGYFNVHATTPSGAYSGPYTVTTTYN